VVLGVLLFPVYPCAGPQDSGGALDIRIHPAEGDLTPPTEFLLTDPRQRRSGRDGNTEKAHFEIPYSSYETESLQDAESGAPGPETRILNIRNPEEGQYSLLVRGIRAAAYSLEIRGYDRNMSASTQVFLNIVVSEGEEHEYLISYSRNSGSQISVRRTE
jgi:hypothetical protein